LFELRPDIIPQSYLTQLEIELWTLFYLEREENHRGRSAKNC